MTDDDLDAAFARQPWPLPGDEPMTPEQYAREACAAAASEEQFEEAR